ncbi:MAG: hypothetical protein JXR77_11285 [Lentisphaeria bacterium]|nr:hypothetical protein [Lentisphaeria bacterium]
MRAFGIVLRTYFLRWQFWLCVVLLACQVPGFLLVASGKSPHFLGALTLFFGVGYVCAGIGIHLKEQFGSSRARLMPGFLWPHLCGGLFWVVCVIGLFALLAACGGGSVPGTLALALPLAGLALAAPCRGRHYAALFGLSWLLLFFPPLATPALRLLSGAYPPAASLLLAGGVLLLWRTARFLVTMDEETPGYETQVRANLESLSRPQARRALSAAIRQLDERNSIWLRLMDVAAPDQRRYVGDSRWQRVRQWRRACGSSWMMLAMPCLVWALVALTQLWMWKGSDTPARALAGTLWIPLFFPQLALVQYWQLRSLVLSREFTYPVRRRDILLEQAAAALWGQVTTWFVLVSLPLVLWLAAPELLPGRTWLILVLVSGAWQPAAFCVWARICGVRSLVPLVVGIGVVSGVSAAGLMGCVHLQSTPLLLGTMALGLLVALGLAPSVRRRWLRRDLA